MKGQRRAGLTLPDCSCARWSSGDNLCFLNLLKLKARRDFPAGRFFFLQQVTLDKTGVYGFYRAEAGSGDIWRRALNNRGTHETSQAGT